MVHFKKGKIAFFSLVCCLFFSCSNDSFSRLDNAFFEFFGFTLIEKPKFVSLKQIHLKPNDFVGRVVFVEADLKMVGDHDTFLILGTKSATMLVNLTSLSDVSNVSKEGLSRVKVLGTVENNRLGLPYINAHAVNKL